MLQDFQPIAAIATTPTGAKQLQPLAQTGAITLWLPESLPQVEGATLYAGALKDHLKTLWGNHRSFVFCLATGAVVRLIAPLLQDKSSDPAIVVVDETGQFVISLCGGHAAGADQLAQTIAALVGATPVLTGAANRADLPGIDVLGVPYGWVRGTGDWTAVSAAIARGERVQVVQEAGSTLWQQHLPADHPFVFGEGESQGEGKTRRGGDIAYSVLSPQPSALTSHSRLPTPDSRLPTIWISSFDRSSTPHSPLPTPHIHWHPRVLWVGIGCERGTSKQTIAEAVRQVFVSHGLAEAAIAGIATIDLKADEVGLLQFCEERKLPLRCYTAAELRSITVPNPSTIVEAEVGTPSVAEASAILASQNSSLLTPHSSLLVSKQIFRLDDRSGAVTIAVAQAEQEYTGRSGNLWLVGTGPGQLNQITPAAKSAIVQADVVIGYSLYVDLISPLLRPGQIVETLPITQERQRAERAIALAHWGLSVAVVSSGDCGIYGMAGLVLEQLQTAGWNGKTPAVQVFPGITALQAAASRVGTPLMHDFCAISLSDLLTPWEVIAKRLTAAAAADFVVALYNPKSQTRTEPIAIAQQIFLQHRSPDTPVAIVRAAYRPDEQLYLTTLAEFLVHPIDMLTTVLIGNQSTRTYADWMVTPRGYLGFDRQ